MRLFLFLLVFAVTACRQSVAQQTGIVYTANEAEDGDGATLLRLFPGAAFKHADPFILLDDFNVKPPIGFPPHEHKGFEAITYMIDGGFVHKDNLGNMDTVFAGGAQRFTAGKSLVHSEMPGTAGDNKGLQLWLNIPVTAKNNTPSYQKVDTLPLQVYGKSTTIRTVVGSDSPLSVQCDCDLTYLDIQLKDNSIEFIPQQGYTSFVYILSGNSQIGMKALTAGQFYFLTAAESNTIKSTETTRFVYLSAKPLNQKIKQRGPYVY